MAKKEKNKQETLKQKLYKMIDDIDDERILNKLSEELAPYITKQKSAMQETDDELTPEQIKELKESIKEAERGETITWEEYKKLTGRWRTD